FALPPSRLRAGRRHPPRPVHLPPPHRNGGNGQTALPVATDATGCGIQARPAACRGAAAGAAPVRQAPGRAAPRHVAGHHGWSAAPSGRADTGYAWRKSSRIGTGDPAEVASMLASQGRSVEPNPPSGDKPTEGANGIYEHHAIHLTPLRLELTMTAL